MRFASHIGYKIDINGCVNFEFIKHKTDYYLIDINQHFSAEIVFSLMTGYNMVLNHIRCFIDGSIDNQTPIKEQILITRYKETAIKFVLSIICQNH